jgi:hypothetical protein
VHGEALKTWNSNVFEHRATETAGYRLIKDIKMHLAVAGLH